MTSKTYFDNNLTEAVVTLFSEFPAVEWVLYFRNEGNDDTPILESVNMLDAVTLHVDTYQREKSVGNHPSMQGSGA